MDVKSKLDAAEAELMNLESDDDAFNSSIDAARAAINAARVLVLNGVEVTAN